MLPATIRALTSSGQRRCPLSRMLIVGLHWAAGPVPAGLANREIEARLQFRGGRRCGVRRDTVGIFEHQTDAIKVEVVVGQTP